MRDHSDFDEETCKGKIKLECLRLMLAFVFMSF